MSEKSGIDSVNDEIDELAAETILKPDIYRSIFSLEDESDIVLAKDQLEEKARALKKLSPVREMLKVWDKKIKSEKREKEKEERERKEKERRASGAGNWTHYGPDANGTEYPELCCGTWEATPNGISDPENGGRICHQALTITGRFRNVEENKVVMEIAWRNAGKAWRSERVPRKVMCKANELVNLADSGLEVHSENARQLVKFFSDLEARNSDKLKERRSKKDNVN